MIVCVCVCVVLFVWSLTRPLCGSPLSQILPIVSNWRFLFVWERIPKTSFSQYFCLTSSPVSLLQFPRPCMEINRVTPGNQPPVRADYPRFSSDCLMIALPPDKAHTSSAKIIAQHYPSKLSDLKIIPHLPPKLSLISASLVNSASTFCNTGSISLRQAEKYHKLVEN